MKRPSDRESDKEKVKRKQVNAVKTKKARKEKLSQRRSTKEKKKKGKKGLGAKK